MHDYAKEHGNNKAQDKER